MSDGQLATLLLRLTERGGAAALHWRRRDVSCAELVANVTRWRSRLVSEGLGMGTVCALRAEYSLDSCAAMLALMDLGAIVVPLTPSIGSELPVLLRIGSVDRLIDVASGGRGVGEQLSAEPNPLIERFRRTGHPGLIVFTSGSTGLPKGILHDVERLLTKFSRPRAAYRTLQFLLFDHFGGMNTLFATLSWGGVAVFAEDRGPMEIARLIEEARVELLPVTPTFLNLFIASGAHVSRDMSSVRLITYGTEVMPQQTLERVQRAFPHARLQQTYGLSELGVLGSRSRESGSLWMQVGGPGFETKVVNGTLRIRSEYAMVGYLNGSDPFDADGWMDTGDNVVQQGDWLRILGRRSDLINVGGQKVFPAEVEDTLLHADNVRDATVFGEPHPLTGSVVVARVQLEHAEDPLVLRERLRIFCLTRLAAYKVPVRFEVSSDDLHTDRFKKQRAVNAVSTQKD